MKNKKDKKLNSMLISILTLGLIVTFISTYLYQSFQIDLIMKDLHKLHQQKKELLSETERLDAQVNRLSNIDVISKTAREKFDLHFDNNPYLVIKIDDMQDLYSLKEQLALNTKDEQKIITAGIQ